VPRYFFSLNQGGISNYGTEPQTKWLYAAGFSGATIGTMLAAIVLPKATKRRLQLRFILLILSALYLVVMVSTFSYKLSPSFQQFHELSALVLFISMLLTSLWLRFIAVKNSYINRLFIFLCICMALGVLNYLEVLHILFVIEVVTGVIFALQLTHWLQTSAAR
jgi:hypothetical protein